MKIRYEAFIIFFVKRSHQEPYCWRVVNGAESTSTNRAKCPARSLWRAI